MRVAFIAWAQLPLGLWDIRLARAEPVSPALAGRLFTTGPPGKPNMIFLKIKMDAPQSIMNKTSAF